MTRLLNPSQILSLHEQWEVARTTDCFFVYTSTLRALGVIDDQREADLDRQIRHTCAPGINHGKSDRLIPDLFRRLRLMPGQLPFRPITEHTLTASRP